MDHQDWNTAYVYLDRKSKGTDQDKKNQTKGPNKEQKMEETDLVYKAKKRIHCFPSGLFHFSNFSNS